MVVHDSRENTIEAFVLDDQQVEREMNEEKEEDNENDKDKDDEKEDEEHGLEEEEDDHEKTNDKEDHEGNDDDEKGGDDGNISSQWRVLEEQSQAVVSGGMKAHLVSNSTRALDTRKPQTSQQVNVLARGVTSIAPRIPASKSLSLLSSSSSSTSLSLSSKSKTRINAPCPSYEEKKKRRRSYTVEFKLRVVAYLRANRSNIMATAAHFSVDRRMVKQWCDAENQLRSILSNDTTQAMRHKRKIHPGPGPQALLHRHLYQKIDVVLMDVHGTVVDWNEGIKRAFSKVGSKHGIQNMKWQAAVHLWEQLVEHEMKLVRTGEKMFMNPEQMHHETLHSVLAAFGLSSFTHEDRRILLDAWQRMKPYKDVISAIQRLRTKFFVVAIANVGMASLLRLSKYMNVSWDGLLGADLLQYFKPDPQVYCKATELLGSKLEDCLVVTSHVNELQVAKQLGMKTCYIQRRDEKRDAEKISLEDFMGNGNSHYVVDTLETAATVLECKPGAGSNNNATNMALLPTAADRLEWMYLYGRGGDDRMENDDEESDFQERVHEEEEEERVDDEEEGEQEGEEEEGEIARAIHGKDIQ